MGVQMAREDVRHLGNILWQGVGCRSGGGCGRGWGQGWQGVGPGVGCRSVGEGVEGQGWGST